MQYMRPLFVLSIILYSCSNDPEEVKEFVVKENLPVETIEGAEMIHTNRGVLKFKIIANTINRFKGVEPQLVFSNGFEVIFYNDSGLVESVLKAVNAEVNEINNIMIASNNVILISSEGKKLETEELIWDEKKNKIYTDKRVIITTEKEMIKGRGFQSTPDFLQYSISNIQGKFNLTN